MIVCSATLHAIEVRRMAERLMYFPTWVDLKGQDAVPETVHHVVVRCTSSLLLPLPSSSPPPGWTL